MRKKCIFFILLIAINFITNSYAQNIHESGKVSLFTPSNSLNKKRLNAIIIGESAVYAIGNVGLYNLWYKGYNTGKFHFFDDNKEWLYMDKLGHSTISYYLGMQGYQWMRWAGVSENKSLIYGGGLGFLFLSTIEIMDGFSEGWGFSYGDIIANGLGTSSFILQQKYLHQQVFKLKNSYHETEFSNIRPNLLGGSLPQRMLKDYNGQTYWLSANLNYLSGSDKIPNWLCASVGYSVNGFVGATDNIFTSKGVVYDYSNIKRYNQFFISLDVDLSKINTKYKWANSIIHTFGLFKIPFPALEFNKVDKLKGHILYF
jgi:hypothetical protein